MVIDFLNDNYSTSYSTFDITYSDVEDEMTAWVLDYISELKYGIKRDSLKSSMAMIIYDTIQSLTGDPVKDYIPYEDIKKIIYNFNLLTNSSIDVNFR